MVALGGQGVAQHRELSVLLTQGFETGNLNARHVLDAASSGNLNPIRRHRRVIANCSKERGIDHGGRRPRIKRQP